MEKSILQCKIIIYGPNLAVSQTTKTFFYFLEYVRGSRLAFLLFVKYVTNLPAWIFVN